ncbi:type VII secretion-associated serine protease mycosin [Streptomyces sp. Tu 2975]|uniref:type VII secretion-associated serine protease mycosin n=1 Tax=Streptomyces sp. Tu 2975 TaxID=2676871 RepID=UPI0032655A03
MHADEMWRVSTGKGITVAVIDTGVDDRLPDLKGQVLPGLNLSKEPGDENSDYDGHGSSMAVIIAGTGKKSADTGSFGLAPGTKILPVRMPKVNQGTKLAQNPELWNRSLSQAIRYAADGGARVINISLAGSETRDNVAQSVKYALDKGSLIFAGVGNDGDEGNRVLYPAATPGVVGVSAVDKNGTATKESQRGPQVDLAAPGDDIIAACPGRTQLCESHGTSDATALASASAALIWSKHPEWTNNQVLRVMMNTAGKAKSGKVRTDFGGYGVVRPRIALKTPGDPGPADEYPLPDLAAADPEPSPEASTTPAGGSEESGPAPSEQSAKAAPASDEGGKTGLWIALGLGAAVLVGGAVTVMVARSRRQSVLPTAVPAMGAGQQAYHPFPQPPQPPWQQPSGPAQVPPPPPSEPPQSRS